MGGDEDEETDKGWIAGSSLCQLQFNGSVILESDSMWSTYISSIPKARMHGLAVERDGRSFWMLEGAHYCLGQQVFGDESLDTFSLAT